MKSFEAVTALSVHAFILAGILGLSTPSTSIAGDQMMASGSDMQTMSEMADGEVRKVDKSAGKITLRHGELKGLDMPPMTMVFQVSDAAMLEKVKAGDKVKFKAKSSGGTLTVTEIEVRK